jgi:methionyl-tRNA synthetase
MTISIDDFKKIEIKIGEILSAEKVEGSDKLLKLVVSFSEENPRQIISGISTFFSDPNELIGKKCAFATNLEPRVIKGLESQGMILAVSGENFFSLLNADPNVVPGASVN